MHNDANLFISRRYISDNVNGTINDEGIRQQQSSLGCRFGLKVYKSLVRSSGPHIPAPNKPLLVGNSYLVSIIDEFALSHHEPRDASAEREEVCNCLFCSIWSNVAHVHNFRLEESKNAIENWYHVILM
jgi:hypothetical protein